jgi:hypothetical protein
MTSEELEIALDERDQILRRMDVDGAKQFIAKHGGFVPKSSIDWVKVLHLARYEVTTMPEDMQWSSRIWLAQHGAQSLMMLPPHSPYLRAAMDLVFPKDVIDAGITAMSANA